VSIVHGKSICGMLKAKGLDARASRIVTEGRLAAVTPSGESTT